MRTNIIIYATEKTGWGKREAGCHGSRDLTSSTGVCVHGGLYIAVRLPHLERERQRCGDSSNRTGDKTMPVRQQERRSRWDSMYLDGRLVSALPIHFSFSHASPCLCMHLRGILLFDSFKVYARASSLSVYRSGELVFFLKKNQYGNAFPPTLTI